MQAVDSVAKEGDAPASEEFRRVVVESRLGRDLVDSLKSMGKRLDSEDFQWVIPAIEINREVGGDLAEVLDTVATTVRDRADIRRQVKTLSAEGRMSAYVLLALPIAIAMMVRASNPTYIGELTHGTGLWLAGIGILLMVIGGFWLFSLCKIEF
jgi:tight adherence protein B